MKKRIISAIMLLVIALFCGVMVACKPDEPVSDGKIKITFIVSDAVYSTYREYPTRRITMPTSPTKDGYVFDAWYTEKNGEGKKVTQVYLLNNAVTEDFYAYAHFVPKQYNISYYLDSAFAVAGESAQNPTEYNVETDFELKAPTITHHNAQFIGWYSGGSKVTNLNGRTGNLYLTARFKTSDSQWSYDTNDENYIYFGSYPQSEVKDTTLLDSLNSIIGSARPNNSNANGWTAEANYASFAKTNIVYYKDVTLDKNEYRAIFFRRYRPSAADLESSTESMHASYQDDNGYLTNTVYWFKFEPIRWQILGTSVRGKLLFSDVILDAREGALGTWDASPWTRDDLIHQNIDASNWGWFYSSCRLWYEYNFLYEAFNVCQSAYFTSMVSVVDDDVANVIRKHESVSDRAVNCTVFNLSREELDGDVKIRGNIATTHTTKFTAETRKKGYTDYAKAMGLFVAPGSTTASYWTRSHGENSVNSLQCVNERGEFTFSAQNTWNCSIGIAPAVILNTSMVIK